MIDSLTHTLTSSEAEPHTDATYVEKNCGSVSKTHRGFSYLDLSLCGGVLGHHGNSDNHVVTQLINWAMNKSLWNILLTSPGMGYGMTRVVLFPPMCSNT